MNIKPGWGSANAALPPPIVSTISGLTARHLGANLLLSLGLAALAGVLCLVSLTIREYAVTRRAELPYKAANSLAEGEVRNRTRYARAQTRRWKRLPGGEPFWPDAATDLIEIMRVTRGSTGADPSAQLTSPDLASGPAITAPPRARRDAKPAVRRPGAAA